MKRCVEDPKGIGEVGVSRLSHNKILFLSTKDYSDNLSKVNKFYISWYNQETTNQKEELKKYPDIELKLI